MNTVGVWWTSITFQVRFLSQHSDVQVTLSLFIPDTAR